MKKDIHPAYHEKASITCACGAVFVVGSTKENIKIELCSQCHPFYTGKQRFVDSQGRLDRFKKKLEKSQEMATARKAVKSKVEKQTAKAKKQITQASKKEK
jgi:large subunit ribosomal protein L31